MKFVAIVQARMDSVRFPGKVMKLIKDIPMIEILLNRLNKSKFIDQVVLATPKNKKNKILVNKVKQLGFTCIKVVSLMC